MKKIRRTENLRGRQDFVKECELCCHIWDGRNIHKGDMYCSNVTCPECGREFGVSVVDEKARTFLVVCESGGYAKAAEKLCISQSGIYSKIVKLENEMGTDLIRYQKTNGGKIVLSRHGEILLQYIKVLLNNEERLSSDLLRCTNLFPSMDPPKERNDLCGDKNYISCKKVLELLNPCITTKYERKMFYKDLRNNKKIRKKVCKSGKRNYIYYHVEDIKIIMKERKCHEKSFLDCNETSILEHKKGSKIKKGELIFK